MSRPNAGERGGMDILTVEGLSKSFAGLSALRDVSLSLRAGEIRAICGENGAGKSTLVKLLMGILAPDAGAITIDGVRRGFPFSTISGSAARRFRCCTAAATCAGARAMRSRPWARAPGTSTCR
jgi:ABC-type branched-subunit amino acid transport system ATPase component